ncbi:MAG: alpha/beta hydrolase [Imperialibacter sp.]|uniref:alpha/beta hydrolase n=1 Tax=Imperialibacter sp. TaxID=2038411 RepID=UPI0032EFB1FA
MNKNFVFTLTFVFSFIWSVSQAQTEVLYKQVDTTRLYVEVINPPGFTPTKVYPAMVFFFGGGWKSGNRYHLENQAKYLAKGGMVCFLADYRTESKNGTTPFEALKDAKSAMRFVRENARQFSVDPNKIAAGGGSAGGHLAAAAALTDTDKFNEGSDDLSVSCVPNALVLYNPVIDSGPGAYGYVRVKEQYKDFSPLHNIKEGAPPTIFLLGTNDNLVPVVTAEYFKMAMEKMGNTCELILYEGQGHGFFNYTNFEYYKKTLEASDVFLQSLGYLNTEPTVVIE